MTPSIKPSKCETVLKMGGAPEGSLSLGKSPRPPTKSLLTVTNPQMWRRVRAAEAPVKKKTENVSASTLTFIFQWWGVEKEKSRRSGETWRLILARTQATPKLRAPSLHKPHTRPSVSPRLPHLADLSPELQYEINVGPAGNERSPQEIEEEGGQKKNSTRSRRTDFWHVDVSSPPCLVSHICLLLRCSCDSKGKKSLRPLLLLFCFGFFSWHSPPLAKPRKWTSREGLFERSLVCVVPRSKTT